jgi:hypothetical protein
LARPPKDRTVGVLSAAMAPMNPDPSPHGPLSRTPAGDDREMDMANGMLPGVSAKGVTTRRDHKKNQLGRVRF